VQAFGQTDSTWNKSVTLRHGSEIIPTTGKSFEVNNIEAKFQKNKNTFVPILSQKSIHGLKGYQVGLAFYRKLNWGYTHTALFYSPNQIFPKTVLHSNIFLKVMDGLEANVGVSSISYADGNALQIIKLGGTYYYKSSMLSYNLRLPLSGFLYHSLSLRKYLKTSNDHFQINLSSGLDNEGLQMNANQPIKVYGVRFSMSKTIYKKIQLQLSFGLTKTEGESRGNKYINYGIGIKRNI